MPTENKPAYFAEWTVNSSESTQTEDKSTSKSSSSSSHVEGLHDIARTLYVDIKHLTKNATLTITNCHLPKDWPSKIIHLIEQNPEASFVAFPKDVLSSQEKKRLETILKPRQDQVKRAKDAQKAQQVSHNERLERAKNDQTSSRNRYLMIGTLLGLGISYAIFPVFLSLATFLVCATGMGIGFVASILRSSETPASETSMNSTVTTVAADAIKPTIPSTMSPHYLFNHTKRDSHENTTDSKLESTRQFIAKLR